MATQRSSSSVMKKRRVYRSPEVRSNEAPLGVHLLTCTGATPVNCLPFSGMDCCANTSGNCASQCPEE